MTSIGRKGLLLVVLALASVFLLGCEKLGIETSAQRIDKVEAAVEATEAALVKYDADIKRLGEVVDRAEVLLAQADIDANTKEKVGEVLAKASEAMDIAIERKVDAQIAIATWKEQIKVIRLGSEDPGIGEELQIWGEGLKAVGPVIPTAGPYIALAGTLLGLIGSMIVAYRKSQRQKRITESIVHSVDSVLDSMEDAEATAAKVVLKDKQTIEASATVSALHNE